MHHMTVTELVARLADQSKPAPLLLDVREPSEYQICHIPGAVLMPMQTIPGDMNTLDPEQEIICICHHGGRSMQVAAFLERQGFEHVTNLSGGVHAWAKEIDSTMPTY